MAWMNECSWSQGKEVVDTFVKETLSRTVWRWTVGQLRALQFLCYTVYFGTTLEKSLRFLYLIRAQLMQSLFFWLKNKDRKFDLGSVHRRCFTSHLPFFGEFSDADCSQFSRAAGCYYWVIGTPHSEQQRWIISVYLQVLVLPASCSVRKKRCVFFKRNIILGLCSISKPRLSSGTSATAITANSIINVLC